MPVVVSELIAKFSANTTSLVAGVAASKAELKGLDTQATATASKVGTALNGVGAAAEGAAAKTNVLTAAMGRVSKEADALAIGQGKIASVGMSIAAVAAKGTVALAGLSLGSAKLAADFDQSMRNVDSIAKLTDKQFQQLSKSVLGLVHDPAIKQSAGNLAEGLYDIYSSGASGKAALEDLRAAAIGASAGMTTTATATRVLMGVLNSGIGGVKSASGAMDVLFQEVNLGVNTFEELAQQIGPLLPLAAKAGISLQEVSAAMAVLTVNGTDAAESATQLQGLISHLVGASGAAAKEMDKLGIAHGLTAVKAEGLYGAIKNVVAATKGHEDVLHDLFPEIRSYIGLLSLTGDGGKKYASFLDQMKHASDGQGAAMEANQRQLKGVKAQYEQLANVLEADLIPAGLKILPVIKDMSPLLKDVAEDVVSVLTAFGNLPEPVQKAIIFFGVAKAASGALGLSFAGLAGGSVKLVGGFYGVKIAGAAVLDTFGIMATEGAAAAVGLGLIGVAAVAAAGDIYLIKRDADLAIDALHLLSDARNRDAATAAGYAALDKTGDNKRNVIGEIAKINFERGNIDTVRKQIQGEIATLSQNKGTVIRPITIGNMGYATQTTDSLVRDPAAANKRLADLRRDLAAQNKSYDDQTASIKRLQAAEKGLKYEHASPYAPAPAPVAGTGAGAAQAASGGGGGASAAAIKAAAQAAKAAARDRKQEAEEAARDAQQRAEQAKNLIGDMQEQIKLYGNESKEAKLLYEIQHGGADYLATAAQRKQALDLARILDVKAEQEAERGRISELLQGNKEQVDSYRELVGVGTNATDRQRLAWEHAHTVIDTLTEADQRFVRGAWASAEAWADRAQKVTLTGEAMTSLAALQQQYADKTNATLGGVKTAAEEAAEAIRKTLDPSGKIGFDISSPELTDAQKGVMSAAIGADTAHASEIVQKWLDDLNAQAGEARERIAGAVNPATKAVDSFLKQNAGVIRELTAILGKDRAGAVVGNATAAITASANIEKSAAAIDNYRRKVSDLNRGYQEISASSPFDAWKASIQEYDKATGSTGGPFGDADLKKLYDYEQGLKDIQEVSAGLTDSIFASISKAFSPSEGMQTQKDFISSLQAQRYSVGIQAANFDTSNGTPNPYKAELDSIDSRIGQTESKIKGMGVSLSSVFRSVFGGIVQEFDSMIAKIAEDALKADLQQALNSVLGKALGKPLGSDANAKLIAAEQAQLTAVQLNTAKMGDLITALNSAAAASTGAGSAAGATVTTGDGVGGLFGALGSLAGLIPGGGAIANVLGIAGTVAGAVKPTSSAKGLYQPGAASVSPAGTTSDGNFSYAPGVAPAGSSIVNINVQTPDTSGFLQSRGQIAQQVGAASARAASRNGK